MEHSRTKRWKFWDHGNLCFHLDSQESGKGKDTGKISTAATIIVSIASFLKSHSSKNRGNWSTSRQEENEQVEKIKEQEWKTDDVQWSREIWEKKEKNQECVEFSFKRSSPKACHWMDFKFVYN